MRTPDTLSPVYEARSAGNRFVDSRLFEILSRAGFVARGAVYLIIGVLAFDLATGNGGKITNQQGAMKTVEHQPFGHFLLALLAVGLGSYAVWRLFRAALGHGPEGADRGIERLGALGSGLVYAALCAVAVKLLTSSSSSGSSGNAKKTASRSVRLARGALARADRGARADRRGHLPVRPRRDEEVSRRRQDGADGSTP